MLDTLTILGGGGWFPAHGRHTASALLRDGDAAVLIDAGTGVNRLVETPALLDGVERLEIVLTHFHLDHVTGLGALPATGVSQRTTVWGPGRALYGVPTADLLSQLLSEPFNPVPLEERGTEVRDLPLGESELAGVGIEARRQDRHSAPTMGLRFGDLLGWITDTAHDPDSAAFAAGCEILAHEAWFTSDAPRNADVHSSAAQAAEVAEQAGIERLLLIHIPPFTPDAEPLAAEARTIVPHAAVAEDMRDVSALLA